MIASDPWTLLITLEEEPDSLGCVVYIQQLDLDGRAVDLWEVRYERVAEALAEMERSYGIGPADWVDLS